MPIKKAIKARFCQSEMEGAWGQWCDWILAQQSQLYATAAYQSLHNISLLEGAMSRPCGEEQILPLDLTVARH